MTIASTTVANSGSSTNGATTQFSFAFHIADYGDVEAEDQIVVRLVTTATGAETVLTRGTSAGQYSVSINADQSASPGGSITTITTYASGYKIWIELSPSFLQATDYQNQGAFLMETVEDQADQQARQILVLKDQMRRAPHLNIPAGASFDGAIAGPFTPGYGLILNGTGTGFALGAALGAGVVSASMAPVIAGTIASALNQMGITDASAVTTAGGTTTYTLTSGVAVTAYASGQTFLIKMNATNTGAATLNVDGLGAKNITKNGTTALVSGDLVSGTIYRVAYDGTQFQVVSGTTLDATLAALAALTISATTWIKGTGTDTFAVESASTTRTSLGLGTAATQNTGTSGGNVPLLNANNTHSGQLAVGTIDITSSYSVALKVENTAGATMFGTKAPSGGGAAVQARVDRSDNYLAYFLFGATNVGSITTDTVNTAYNTTSDYRLKENVAAIPDALGIIRALNPVAFNFIGFDKRQGGFLAHEVQALIPEAVHGEKDAVEPLFSVFDANRVRVIGPVDAREAGVLAAAVYMQGGAFEPDGTRLVSQGLDMAKIVPYAVAAIQSLAARVEALEAA